MNLSWLGHLWAGLTSHATLIIAGAGLWIAWEQRRIANVQLRHELYDRKFRVYGTAKGLLVSFLADGRVSRSAFQAYVEGTADAEFLFKKDVLDYLQQLRERAARNMIAKERLTDGILSADERDELAGQCLEDMKWFVDQFDEIRRLFMPTMQIT